MDIIMGEIDKNKETAEKQIEVLVDLQKVVDTQHEEFLKNTPRISWFPTPVKIFGCDTDPKKLFEFEHTMNTKYKGFDQKLQQKLQNDPSASDVCFYKSRTEDALMDLYLCELYMGRIVDKTLVDQIPKILNLTLVLKTVDFLQKFLLVKVQKACKNEEKKREVLRKSAAHEEKMRDLVMKQRVYTDTIEVIKVTKKQLREIKE